MNYPRLVILLSAAATVATPAIPSPPPAAAVGEGFSIRCPDGWERCYESAAMICGEIVGDAGVWSFDVVNKDEAGETLVVRCVEATME